jgi:glycerol kinase
VRLPTAARAVLEAAAFQVEEVLGAMRRDSGAALRVLKVDGGMTANALLMQFQVYTRTTVYRLVVILREDCIEEVYLRSQMECADSECIVALRVLKVDGGMTANALLMQFQVRLRDNIASCGRFSMQLACLEWSCEGGQVTILLCE